MPIITLTPRQQDDLVTLLARCATEEFRGVYAEVRSHLTPYRAENLRRKGLITYVVQDDVVYTRFTRDGYWKAVARFVGATSSLHTWHGV